MLPSRIINIVCENVFVRRSYTFAMERFKVHQLCIETVTKQGSDRIVLISCIYYWFVSASLERLADRK